MNNVDDNLSELSHEEFVELYNQGRLNVHIDPTEAWKICAFNPIMPLPTKIVFQFWALVRLFVLLAAFLGTPISLFFIKWYESFVFFMFFFYLSKIVNKGIGRTAREEILSISLRDPFLYQAFNGLGVLSVEIKAC